MIHFLCFNITEKSLHLLSLWKGSDQLRIFRADLQEEGSFDDAVKGCIGVFHVAASMQFNISDKENTGNAQCIHNFKQPIT
jgi:uncharacterized protein YbjT (DUF2867 family)